MSRIVDDAGTISEWRPRRGKHGDVVECTRLNLPKHGDDCAQCGGVGLRTICARECCYEYGCHGICGMPQKKGGAA